MHKTLEDVPHVQFRIDWLEVLMSLCGGFAWKAIASSLAFATALYEGVAACVNPITNDSTNAPCAKFELFLSPVDRLHHDRHQATR